MSRRSVFILSLGVALLWLSFSFIFSFSWVDNLSLYIGRGYAWVIITGLALIPGFTCAFLLSTYAFDVRPPRENLKNFPGLSILVAAFNEEAQIKRTIESILAQGYEGPIEILVLDDGSLDQTILQAESVISPFVKVLALDHGGKAAALNQGLEKAAYDLIITLDADTELHKAALKNIVEEIESRGPEFKAIAGSVYALNSKASWMAATQSWDYLHFIAAIKRSQSFFEGTLVAQGAFSIYRKEALIQVLGWPKTLGEDIVLSWAFLKRGWKAGWAEDAIALTSVPESYKGFFRQRCRWARGLFEAFRHHPRILLLPRFITFHIYLNIFFPLIDLCYCLIFLPGLIAACFGCFFIVGLPSLILLPLSLAMNLFIFFRQKKIFHQVGFAPEQSRRFFFIYWLFYSMLVAPACVWGYCKELCVMRKKW